MRRIGLAQRQKIEQQADQRIGIAADMAAVRQDLVVELLGQTFGALALECRGAMRTKTEFGERYGCRKPFLAGKPGSELMREEMLHAHEAAHEAAIEGKVRAFEDHRRLRQKGDEPAGDDLRLPCHALVRLAGMAQKIIDEAARVAICKGAVCGAQMRQPTEAI